MNSLTIFFALSGLSLCLAQVIDLRPYDVTAQQLFDSNDIDKDKEFSLAELHLSFDGYDSNSSCFASVIIYYSKESKDHFSGFFYVVIINFYVDGVVSREEYTMYVTHQNPAMFVLTHALYDIYDSDKNGVLTEYDYDQLYKLWDSNENNVVSELEFVHWWTVTLTSLDHLHHPDATFPPTTSV